MEQSSHWETEKAFRFFAKAEGHQSGDLPELAFQPLVRNLLTV